MCLMIPAEVVRAACELPISRELLALIDKHQRRYLPEPAWPQLAPEQPIALLAPLTAEEAQAAEEADQARLDIDAKIHKLHEHPAPRALNCGTYSPTIHLRRDGDGGAVEDALIRTSCGRSDCPRCWRRRLTKTYRRAAMCLLDKSRDSRLPRTEHLHVAETTWREWESYDRAMRRQHSDCVAANGRCNLGRLRVRRADNSVLVVCECPFHGSRPVTPAEALRLTVAAIDQMHTARHSYRQLGTWSDREETMWKQIAVYPKVIDFAEVRRQLEEAQRKSHLFKSPDLKGLVWRCESETAAAALETIIQQLAGDCPSLSPGKDRSSLWPKSDRPEAEDTIDDTWPPFDTRERWTGPPTRRPPTSPPSASSSAPWTGGGRLHGIGACSILM